MPARIVRGNALELKLADDSVDLVVTSPPYFGLRSYTDGGAHYAEQVGAEATPAEYVDALIAATREMVRVLKPSGSLWVNLGDKYGGRGGGPQGATGGRRDRAQAASYAGARRPPAAGGKSLMGLPWRYALRCIDELGLILRAEIIWDKPNGLPESVRDRVRRSHEQWFHFTLSPRYYANVDEVREPQDPANLAHHARYRGRYQGDNPNRKDQGTGNFAMNPLGKLPGSVWRIATQPLRVPAELGIDHFAAFPMEWPRRIITGWSPPGICTACGEGRRAVADKVNRPLQTTYNGTLTRVPGKGRQDYRTGVPSITEATITGYACACPTPDAPTRPALILDPFGGTGTTALVADVLGRDAISVDLSADYCRLARWRVNNPQQRARVLKTTTGTRGAA